MLHEQAESLTARRAPVSFHRLLVSRRNPSEMGHKDTAATMQLAFMSGDIQLSFQLFRSKIKIGVVQPRTYSQIGK